VIGLFSLEEEKMNVTNLHQKSLHEQREAAVLLEESNLLVVSLNEQLRILEEGNQKLTGSHQNLTIKVQLLDGEKAQTTRMLEESILAVQSLQVDTSKLICTISDLKEELVKAHEEIQTLNAEFSRIKEEKRSALLVHADLLAQFKLKEEEKVDLAKELEDSKLLNQSLQVDNLQLVRNVSKLREEIGKSQEDVLTLNDRVHSLEEENTSLLASQHKSLLQMQALEEEKVDIRRSLEESVDLAQKLERDKLQLQSVVMNLEQELERKREELQIQIVRIHDFGQDNDRLMSEYNSLLQQFKSVEEEAVHMVKSLNDSKSREQNLELENADHAKAARRLKEEGQRSDEEIATLINQVLTLEEEKEKLTSLHEELLRQVHSLEQEKMHFVQLVEESKILVESLEQEQSQHNTAVSGLEQEVPEEINTAQSHSWTLEEEVTSGDRDYVLELEDDNLQLRNALKDANVLITDLQEEVDTLKSYVVDMEEGKEKSESGRVQLLVELSDLRKQVQAHEEKLEDSETSKKSRHEALELAKQIETYREQVRTVNITLQASIKQMAYCTKIHSFIMVCQ
jgi:chromosome segregation ATPase